LPLLVKSNEQERVSAGPPSARRRLVVLGSDTDLILAQLVGAGIVFLGFFLAQSVPDPAVVRWSGTGQTGVAGSVMVSSGPSRRRKRRHDHPEKLPRNPTLAEDRRPASARPEEPEPPPGRPRPSPELQR